MTEKIPLVLSEEEVTRIIFECKGSCKDARLAVNVAQRDADAAHYEPLIQQAKREIFEVYDAYIKLFGEELDSLMGLAISHGWHSTRAEAGEKCRADIQSLKSKHLKE